MKINSSVSWKTFALNFFRFSSTSNYCYVFLSALNFIFFSACNSYAQINKVKGQVFESNTKSPLPFVHLIVNDSIHLLSDIDGNFKVASNTPVKKIVFKNYLYRQVLIDHPGDSVQVQMNKSDLFSFSEQNDLKSKELLSRVQDRRRSEQKFLVPYSYTTYNKFTLSADKNDKANEMIKKFSKLIPFNTEVLKEDQHLLITESVTEKKYINNLHQKELITGSRSSHITVPSVFVQTTKVQSLSVYDAYISIAGKEFIGPFNKDHSVYCFSLIDEFSMNGNKIYVIKFNPLPGKNYDVLKGLLYVNAGNYSILAFSAGQAEDLNPEIRILQSYKESTNSFFPDRTKTIIISQKDGPGIKVSTTGNSYIDHIVVNDEKLKKKDFDEVVLEYNKASETKGTEFWKANRKTPLTRQDSLTFAYYSGWDKKGIIERFLTIGENLSYGYMPVGKINIDMNRLLTFNEVEAIRVGVGAHTNERFSEKVIAGGYLGYGIKDKRIKFGADFSHRIEKSKQVWYRLAFSHDLTEAGGVYFSFERPQYSSEVIRKFRLRILDLSTVIENSVFAHPFKYLDLQFALNQSRSIVTYSYNYKEKTSGAYNFTELRAGFRVGFGEQFIKFLSNRKSLGTKYPVVYFQYTKGIKEIFGEFSYSKFDLKIEQNFRIRNLGVTTFQFIGGVTLGDAPYQKLYNMRGSLKSPSFVIHNSFETMRYNEFLSDRYFAFFLSHNLGRIKINHPNFQPSILLMHNIGYGDLSNLSYHKFLPFKFKTMNKGYVESGAFADNILVANLAGMKTGFGAGLFLRYGYYASLRASENVVFKFSVNFGI